MERYLEQLLGQIQCKKARPAIEREIRGHIEEQISANLALGMTYKEAEENAVKDMGDPIETGAALNKIHRPRFAWKIFLLVGTLSMLGIIVQRSILGQTGYANMEPVMKDMYRIAGNAYAKYIILGLFLMCIICFVDYAAVEKYAKCIGAGIVFTELLLRLGVWGTNASRVLLRIGYMELRVSGAALMMLYVPVYGAILHRYRNGDRFALDKCLLWMFVPILTVPNIVPSIVLMFSMLVQLTMALKEGWFKVPAKKMIASLWVLLLGSPIFGICFMYISGYLRTYQSARIQAFLTSSGDGFYITGMLRNIGKNVALIGESGNTVIGILPDMNKDYIFTYILNSYGLLAGTAVVFVLIIFLYAIFGAVLDQKNEIGKAMGLGCGMIFALNIVMNLLENFGAIPTASSFMPFISVGRDNIILCYVLMGIIMSIYRWGRISRIENRPCERQLN